MLKKEWRCWGCHSAGEVAEGKVCCQVAGDPVEPPLVADYPRFDSCPYRQAKELGRPALTSDQLKLSAAHANNLRTKGMECIHLPAAVELFERSLQGR